MKTLLAKNMKKRKKNAEELVYLKLKQAIVKRYIKQGSKLVEDAIARQIGVSRTPVRMAIKRLELEGLANFVPNKGAVVVKPTLTEIEQTFAVRTYMEKMGVELAATVISKPQIDELRLMVEREKKVFDERNLDDYYVINTAFHLKIAEASGNKVLYHYIEQLLERTKIYLILFDPFFKFVINPSAAEHRAIVEALADHDSNKASHAIEEHLRSALVDMETKELIPEDYIVSIPGLTSPELYVESMIDECQGVLDVRPSYLMVERSYSLLKKLEKWGVHFIHEKDGSYRTLQIHVKGTVCQASM